MDPANVEQIVSDAVNCQFNDHNPLIQSIRNGVAANAEIEYVQNKENFIEQDELEGARALPNGVRTLSHGVQGRGEIVDPISSPQGPPFSENRDTATDSSSLYYLKRLIVVALLSLLVYYIAYRTIELTLRSHIIIAIGICIMISLVFYEPLSNKIMESWTARAQFIRHG